MGHAEREFCLKCSLFGDPKWVMLEENFVCTVPFVEV